MPAPHRLLIVDDYRDALDSWALYLRMRGFQVDTAADGLNAVLRALAHPPDAIVMDLRLPLLDGCDAARRLREHDITAHVPIIATTGDSNPASLDRAWSVGFARIMIKPCVPTLMVEEIERVLHARPVIMTRSHSDEVRNRAAPTAASKPVGFRC